ncbi:ABC transporter ATP-binding protein [Cognatiluteimonas profundi]|uniref:ABC transporter ATP-binding protein n=1 Tax=Cognatiluteimonas profundi TaxID=2594501 RepID=UPI00131C53D9|nr:ATP-binding cassette domain-containing protein [Lysobacter profundi]
MYLNVRDVMVDFPLSVRGHGQASVPGAQPLGGRIHSQGRRTYVRALEGVSFDLGPGDRLAMVGHNGSGKSTLLRVLAGIYHPTTGHVRTSGSVSGIFNMSLGFRQEATGYRNLVLKGLMSGRTLAQIDAALPEIAEFTGLGPYLDMPLHTYSQGMAMRLAFAATTAFTNDILVMDEWIGAGDAGFQEKIIARMNDFLHASTIIVVASHSATLLRRIANKAIWLEHGAVRMAGGLDVIDEYEAAVSTFGLEPNVLAQVRSGRGLWLAPATAEMPTPHLLWHLSGETDGLQLCVRPSESARHVLRATMQRCGAWPLADWVRPGMAFEISDPTRDEPVSRHSIPLEADYRSAG